MENQTIKPNEETPEIESAVPGKDIAIIAYITVIGLIIAFIMNKDKQFEFASFHIKQMTGLVILGVLSVVIGFIPILGWLIELLIFIPMLILWIIGLMNAINGKKKEVPLVGGVFTDLFKNI